MDYGMEALRVFSGIVAIAAICVICGLWYWASEKVCTWWERYSRTKEYHRMQRQLNRATAFRVH